MKAIAVLALMALTTPAIAQQTNCRWIGNTWNCDTPTPAPGVNWGNFHTPNYNDSVMDGFNQAVQMRQQQEAYRQQQQAFAAARQAEADKSACRASVALAIDARDFERAKTLSAIC